MRVQESIYWIGVHDPDLRIFDIVIPTEWGTTYNSYLIQGTEKTAVVDSVKANFTGEFLTKVEAHLEPTTIDFIVVNHTEPDHAGSLGFLMERAPQAVVLCSRPAYLFLKEQLNRDFPHQIVGEGDEVSLGDLTLQFIMAPWLHWPDTIFTYLPERKTLFTCDAFGSHYSPAQGRIFDTDSGDFAEAFRHYYLEIMSPFKPKILEAMAKLEGLEIELICTGHGPILSQDPRQYINRYEEWSRPESLENPTVFIGYASAYGYTQQMAQEIAKGARESLRIDLVDLTSVTTEEAALRAQSAHGVVVGSPTLNSDVVRPVWDLLISLSGVTNKGKPAAAFGSYGWSGEAVGMMTQRLEALKFKLVSPGLKMKFQASKEDREALVELGRSVARAISS